MLHCVYVVHHEFEIFYKKKKKVKLFMQLSDVSTIHRPTSFTLQKEWTKINHKSDAVENFFILIFSLLDFFFFFYFFILWIVLTNLNREERAATTTTMSKRIEIERKMCFLIFYDGILEWIFYSFFFSIQFKSKIAYYKLNFKVYFMRKEKKNLVNLHCICRHRKFVDKKKKSENYSHFFNSLEYICSWS